MTISDNEKREKLEDFKERLNQLMEESRGKYGDAIWFTYLNEHCSDLLVSLEEHIISLGERELGDGGMDVSYTRTTFDGE